MKRGFLIYKFENVKKKKKYDNLKSNIICRLHYEKPNQDRIY